MLYILLTILAIVVWRAAIRILVTREQEISESRHGNALLILTFNVQSGYPGPYHKVPRRFSYVDSVSNSRSAMDVVIIVSSK
jgi:hypothetical protein